MSTFSIPSDTGEIRQVNRGDIFGELWATRNIDLSTSPGKIKASNRLKRILTNSTLGSFDIVGLHMHDQVLYALTTDTLFECSVNDDPTDGANWSENATVGGTGGLSLGFESDIVTFRGDILISATDDIHKYSLPSSLDTDWWTGTISGSALTAGVPHIMHVHRGGAETLFVTDGNTIRYYNVGAGHTSISFNPMHTTCAIASGVDTVWIGTYTETGDFAFVYEVQVGNSIASQAYRIDGRAVLAMEVHDNVPYIVTDRGHIQSFNGSGFATVASFPFSFSPLAIDGVRPGLVQTVSISRAIHPKGMKKIGDSFFIFVNTANEYTEFDNRIVDERSPAGVWDFNLTTQNLNHRFSLVDQSNDAGASTLNRTSPLLITDNQFTRFLVGGEVTSTSSVVGLFGEDTAASPISYFITPELTAQTVTETYEKVVLKAKTMGASESIDVKYRTSKRDPIYADAVWLNTTRFNATTSLTGVQEGDEVEIISGEAAGEIAHITAIDGVTVTIDTALSVALNDTSVVRFMNWTKINDTYDDEDGEFKNIGLNQTAPWIQYKVVIRGQIELRQFKSKGNAKNEL